MAAPPHEESDDFSLFLHQIMLRSSSSSAAPSLVDKKEIRPVNDPLGSLDCGVQVQRVMVSGSDRVPLPEVSSGGGLQWSSGGVFASLGTCFGDRVVNVPSSSVSVGTGDNDLNEYDCESEGFEGAADGALLKPTAGRCSSSKRSRAAEVHNQSEKRRRSRINEKMKALQDLIPNSNKTDKASMLDEAIDYLKQLQLQVQMLTMRNGLSLYPMCVPGAVQPNQICETKMMDEGNARLASLLAPAPSNLLFTPPDNYVPHKQASVFNLPRLNDSESAHQSAFHFPLPPTAASPRKGNCMEGKLPCPQPDSFNARASRIVEEDSLEACVLGGDESGGLFLSNQMEFGKVEMSQGDDHRVEELH